jgi:acyl-[acyl carrier protein]--UDP-N-acetylglucosamine O-acyltransferase
MTIAEKIAATTQDIEQAAQQTKFWEEKRVLCIGRLNTLQEFAAEEEAAQAAEKKLAEDAANKPADA